jgi:hypothetical protein
MAPHSEAFIFGDELAEIAKRGGQAAMLTAIVGAGTATLGAVPRNRSIYAQWALTPSAGHTITVVNLRVGYRRPKPARWPRL